MNDLKSILIPAVISLVMLFLICRNLVSMNRVVMGCGLYLAPFVFAIFGCFPSMDDWSYADSGRHDWWSCQRAWYLGWSGRIGATALLSSWGLVGGSWFAAVVVYRLIVMLLIVSLAVAIWDVSKALLRTANASSQPRDRVMVTVAIAVAWLSSMPDLTEGLYWLAGAATYSAGSCLGLFAFSCVLHARSDSEAVSPWRWRMAVLASFMAPLFSEVVAVLVCAILGLLVLVTPGMNRWRILAPLLASMFGLVIVVLAPGNILRSIEAARLGQVPGDHAFFSLVSEGARLACNFIADSSLAASAALALFVSSQVVVKARPGSVRIAVGILSATVVLIVVAALPMAWTGMSPLRAWNPVSLVVAIGLVAFALHGGPSKMVRVCLGTIMCGSLWLQAWAFEAAQVVFLGTWMMVGLVVLSWRRTITWQALAAGLALGFLFGSDRFLDATRDVFGRGPAYVLAQQRRLAVIAAGVPGSDLRVDRLSGDLPYLYHHEDIDLNETTWQNVSQASFFGLKSIRAIPEPLIPTTVNEPEH